MRVEERLYINQLGNLGGIRRQVNVNPLQPVDLARSKSFIPPALSTTRSTLDKGRVAVLPLQNMSPDPNDEYFADGMTEELIDRLAQVKSLKVIARTSVMKYKGSQKGALEVGKELNIGTLIEGSIRKAGNRVRVTVQLINAGTEEHLWSSHYDKNLDDIFAVQSEIAEKVVEELKTKLLDSEKRTLEKKPTENTDAYTCFLRGRELFMEETEDSLRQALTLLEKAVVLDPTFARAYVGVADCHGRLADYGYELAEVSVANQKSSLKRAIDLDASLPEAHAGLSAMHWGEDDVLGAEAEARKALELNPSLPDAYAMLSEVLALKGDPEGMVKQIETAHSLDPMRARFIFLLGSEYLWTGRDDEALELCKKAQQLAPASTYRFMTEFHLTKLNLEKAEEFQTKAEKLEPTNPRIIWMGGFIGAMQGDTEKAFFVIKKIEEAKMGPIGFNYIAYIYHALGDLDSFFQYMNRAIDEHASIPMILMYSPLLAKARADPRYTELLEKLRKQTGLTK